MYGTRASSCRPMRSLFDCRTCASFSARWRRNSSRISASASVPRCSFPPYAALQLVTSVIRVLYPVPTLFYSVSLSVCLSVCMFEWFSFVRTAGGRVRQQRGPAARDLPDPRQRRHALRAAPLLASLPRSDPRRRASTRANVGRSSQTECCGGDIERAVTEPLLTHSHLLHSNHLQTVILHSHCQHVPVHLAFMIND